MDIHFVLCENMRSFLTNTYGWKSIWDKNAKVDNVGLAEWRSINNIKMHGLVNDWLYTHTYSSVSFEYDDLTQDEIDQHFEKVYQWCEQSFGPEAKEALSDAHGEPIFRCNLYKDRRWATHFGTFYFKTPKEELLFKLHWDC